MMTNLDSIHLFVKVSETGSFSRAARALGVPKSTVSRRITELESQLGLRLLHRTTRKVALTEAGHTYFQQCAPAISTLTEAGRVLAQTQVAPRGLLRISTMTTFGQLFLADILLDFMRAYPEIHAQVDLSERHVDLISEGFDLAIRGGRLPDSTLVQRPLGDTTVKFYASPDYLAARGTPQTPQALTEHDCILYSTQEGPTQWEFRDRHGTRRVPVRGRFAANSFSLMKDAAIAGMGIARLPSFLTAQAMREGRLLTVLDASPQPPMKLQAVYPTARHLSMKVRVFLDFLTERLTPPPWDDEGPPRRARPR